jgi:hypothetical protein
MLFNRPWLRDVKVTHDWGNNMITIHGNGIIRTIAMTKHLSINLKRPKVLLCFDYQNGIINEEEDLMFANEPELFSIDIISLPLKILKTVVVSIIQTKKNTKTIDSIANPFCNSRNNVKIVLDNKLKVSLEDKVYHETYFHHIYRSSANQRDTNEDLNT